MKTIKQEGLTYELNQKTCKANILLYESTGKVIIPKSIEHEGKEYIIEKIIGPDGYHDTNTNISSVYIENDSEISTIDEYAFAGLININSINIPSSIIFINSHAFHGCSNLTNIQISDNSKLQGIGDYAFYSCKIQNIDFLKFPKLKYIGKNAFYSSKINSIKFPSQVEKIDDYAFGSCSNLYNIDFLEDSELRIIGNYTFYSTKIQKIRIPSQVEQIGNNSFYFCENLVSFEFEKNSKISYIGCDALSQTKIQFFSIPSSLNEISSKLFTDINELQTIKVSEDNKHFKYIDDCMLIYKKEEESEIYNQIIYVKKDVEQVNIPSYITEISDYAFYKCSKLKNISIPNNSELHIIGKYSFYSTSLEILELPDSVEYIGEYSFYDCKSLKTITINQNSDLKFINKGAFINTIITSINLPPKIKSIGPDTFANTDRLKSFTFNDNPDFKVISKGLLETSSFNSYTIQCIKIPSGIEKIEQNAFKGRRYLKLVEFCPNSKLQIIEKAAFQLCGIEEIQIPSCVRIIGDEAFQYCENLKIVNFIGNSQLRSIGSNAFYGCSMKSFKIGQYINNIKGNCFSNTKFLEKIEISKENKHFCIVNNYLLLFRQDKEDQAFNYLVHVLNYVEHVKIPQYIEEIGMYAFYGCKNLKYFEIEKDSNINYIHRNIFYGLNVDTIIIPSRLLSIRSYIENYEKIINIGITDEEMKIDKYSFNGIPNLTTISFPYANKIEIERGSPRINYFIKCKCQIICREPTIETNIRRISDEYIIQNMFASKKEEIEFYQKKLKNK